MIFLYAEAKSVLALMFFVSIFSTLVWIIYALSYISEVLGGLSFSSLGLTDVAVYIMIVIAPVLVLWMIFGYVMQFIGTKAVNNNLFTLFKQMKKSQDYTDLMARIMIEAEQGIKDGFVLNKFDLFIADVNELLSDIIYRANLASGEQIERLWKKAQSGSRWAFGKVIIEVNSSQVDFQSRIYERAKADQVLAGTVLEFCARYSDLINILEKHDKEKFFLNMIENGVFGKVFSVIIPVADEIRRIRSEETVIPKFAREEKKTTAKKIYNYEPNEADEKKSFISKLSLFRKKDGHDEEAVLDRHEDKNFLSGALERSFGAIDTHDEPKFEEPVLKEPKIESEKEIFVERQEPDFETNTEKTLHSLKKEWEMMKADDAPLRDREGKIEESLSYPFSGWTDEENYKK